MKPFHTYVFTFMILIGLSACSGSDVLPEPERLDALRYAVNIDSRAALLHTDCTQIAGFSITAATVDGASYIDADSIVRQADGSYTQIDGFDRYWPTPGTRLGFIATRGIDSDRLKWNDKRSILSIDNYNVSPNIEDQIDFLIANTGILTSPPKTETSQPVSLNFRHALCQIVLQARNIDPALDVEINGIGLKHIQSNGTLTATLTQGSATPFVWTLPNISDQSKPTYKILLDRTIELHGDTEAAAQSLCDAAGTVRTTMLMLPQTLVAFDPATRPHGASLMLHINAWNVADDSGQHDPDSTGDKKIWGLSSPDGEWLMIPLSETWLPGQRYVYTITFGGDVIASGYEEDEQNPDKGRVFRSVGFTVDIEPWIPGGDIEQNIF